LDFYFYIFINRHRRGGNVDGKRARGNVEEVRNVQNVIVCILCSALYGRRCFCLLLQKELIALICWVVEYETRFEMLKYLV
jgi:hypothetical protein